MECSGVRFRVTALAVVAVVLTSASGCLGPLLATGIYVAQGGNVIPAEYDGLKNRRVVVLCRPPAAHDFRHGGAARNIARRVGSHLRANVKGIKLVDQKEVDNWIDGSGGEDYKDLGRAVNAEMLVHIELDDFSLFKGRTLYQGKCEATVTVYNMKDQERIVWESSLGEILYPKNSGIPAQDKSPQKFQGEFEEVIAEVIAIKFYKHDAHRLHAMDALANR